MSVRLHRRAVVALALALVAGACQCSAPDTIDSKCVSDADCPRGQFCNPRTAQCESEDFACELEGQCCAGQICAQETFCLDKFTECLGDSTCTVKGQVCRAVSTQSDKLGCTFEHCDASGGCPEGLDCFNGYCVGEAPCNRACGEGEVCTPVNNRCFKLEGGDYPPSCHQSCAPGMILTFVDGYNVFNRCDRTQKDCACVPLPPIRPKDMVRYSSLAATPTKLLVSAYSTDHGDLVVHTFGKDGRHEGTEWVDGLPTTGAIIADPNGPRGGRAAPGPDVGTHTAIAHDPNGSVTHVAYYAVLDGNKALGDLRYARRSGTGGWVVHTVDGAEEGGLDTGDAGQYASITLSPEGYPIIAYFQKSGVNGSVRRSGIKVARAKVREPARAADWNIALVQDGATTPPPCVTDQRSGCADGEVCVESADPGANGECRRKSARPSDCRPACEAKEACALDDATQPACYAFLKDDALATIPEGNGLYTSIAWLDTRPVVVWYDSRAKVLKGAIATADSNAAGSQFGTVHTLDAGLPVGASAGPQHDVGRFASVAVGPADVARRIAVAYFDATGKQLRLFTSKADFSDRRIELVDEGVGDPEADATLFVGTDPSVRFDAQKRVTVLYQDATRGDLRLATQAAGGFEVEVLRQAGANGFFANLVVEGTNRWVSHAIVKAGSQSESANRLEVFALP